jgi:hypothetical protein
MSEPGAARPNSKGGRGGTAGERRRAAEQKPCNLIRSAGRS